jgi:hypothetical protein
MRAHQAGNPKPAWTLVDTQQQAPDHNQADNQQDRTLQGHVFSLLF